MAIILPSLIKGPAYIGTGGVIIHTKADIAVEEMVESWTPQTNFGDAGERHKSRMFKLTFEPVGMLTAALVNYFYEAHLAPQTYVGQSIFPASNQAVTIYSVTENKTYGYVRGGIMQPPDLYCTPSRTAFGAMSLLCTGAAATLPTAANFIKQTGGTIGSLDASFSQASMISDIYTGALGALGSPFNALGGMDGFAFKFGYKTVNILAGDVGVADVILDAKGFNLSAAFAPSNLTEAQVDTLLGYQGASAVLPGQPYGGSAEAGDLVLTGQVIGWTFTAHQLGAKSAKRVYKLGEHRFPNGAIEMVNQLTATTGVPDPLFAFTHP